MNNADFLRYGNAVLAAERALRAAGSREYQIGKKVGIRQGGILASGETTRFEAMVRVSWGGVVDGVHCVQVVPFIANGWPSDKAINEYLAIRDTAEQWALDPFASELPPSGPWEKQ